MKLPNMQLTVGDNMKSVTRNSRLKPRWAVMDDYNKVVLLQGFDNERDAQATCNELLKHLVNQDTGLFLKVCEVAVSRLGARETIAIKMIRATYEVNKSEPKHKLRSRMQGMPCTFAQAYGTAQMAAAKDPKSEAFINVSKELGYEVTDLYEMDETLKEKIADVVDYEFDKCRTDGQIKQPKTVVASPYGTPVIPSTPDEPEDERVELDAWDVMAGRHRSNRDMHTTKKEWEPDQIDPNVDPLEGIR